MAGCIFPSEEWLMSNVGEDPREAPGHPAHPNRKKQRDAVSQSPGLEQGMEGRRGGRTVQTKLSQNSADSFELNGPK